MTAAWMIHWTDGWSAVVVATASPTLDRAQRQRLALDTLAEDPLDGARHAGVHAQLRVRRVHDGVDGKLGDVSGDDLEVGPADRCLHDPPMAAADALRCRRIIPPRGSAPGAR